MTVDPLVPQIAAARPAPAPVAAPQCLLLRVLSEDAGAGIALLDERQRVVSASPEFASFLGLGDDAPRTGPLSNLLPEEVAAEQARCAEESLARETPVRVHGVIGGQMVLLTYRPIAGADVDREERRLVLLTVRSLVGRPGGEAEAAGSRRARHDHDPTLQQLTGRELEVLRYIGLGLSTADIAKRLHRSVKTIEWHRVSLGNKLRVNNRVELARIAIRSGLSAVDDGAPEHDGQMN